MRYRGKPVWVGRISRDIGTRLTIHSPTLTTHKIDPDVDEARKALAEDMAYSQNLTQLGFVRGEASPARRAEPEPHHRSVLHRRVSTGTRIRPPPHVSFEIEVLPVGEEHENQQHAALGSEQ